MAALASYALWLFVDVLRALCLLGSSRLLSTCWSRPALSCAFSVRNSALASSTCLIFSQSSSSCCRFRALKAC